MDSTSDRLIDLCARLREVVLPFLGRHAAREQVGSAVGGDVTFDIDERAEGFLEACMADRLPGWACYSEDRGLQGASRPELVLIVDPIDGTRPAAAGFESACVSVAAVPPLREPTMADVVVGVVQEIKSGDLFVAERGAGVEARRADGSAIPLPRTSRTGLEGLFWSIGFRGRPALVLSRVLEELIDTSSVRGAVFDIGSAAYSITRVLTGQLDAYVDVGPAIIAAHPETEADFRRVGLGAVLNNSPYDLAAAQLLAREAGGGGRPWGAPAGPPLDRFRLLGSGVGYQMSSIVSGNEELQARLVEVVQRGLREYVPCPSGKYPR
jgi:myo-inositol-1(or 4)-monophosphatase